MLNLTQVFIHFFTLKQSFILERKLLKNLGLLGIFRAEDSLTISQNLRIIKLKFIDENQFFTIFDE